MPEGHTIHRLAGAFRELFAGSPVRVSSPQGRFAPGAGLIDGAVVARVEAHGKHMFVGFDVRPGTGPDAGTDAADDGSELAWLRVHLGLYGAWSFAGDDSAVVVHAIGAPRRRFGERETTSHHSADEQLGADADPGADAGLHNDEHDDAFFVPPAPRGQVRARILGAHAVADLTGPSACEVITNDERLAVLARLGPDPLRLDADPQAFIDRVRRSRTPVGVQLMNQDVIAGVGNIYRAEALFRARLNPFLAGTNVTEPDLRAIWDDLGILMADGVAHGAIVTTREADRGRGHELGQMDPRRVRQNTDGDSDAVPREESFYVYHRDGLACRVCGTVILMRMAAGRTLFYCPVCQA